MSNQILHSDSLTWKWTMATGTLGRPFSSTNKWFSTSILHMLLLVSQRVIIIKCNLYFFHLLPILVRCSWDLTNWLCFCRPGWLSLQAWNGDLKPLPLVWIDPNHISDTTSDGLQPSIQASTQNCFHMFPSNQPHDLHWPTKCIKLQWPTPLRSATLFTSHIVS